MICESPAVATPPKRAAFHMEPEFTLIFQQAAVGRTFHFPYGSHASAANARRRLYAHREWLKHHRPEIYLETSKVKLSIDPDLVVRRWRVLRVYLPCKAKRSSNTRQGSAIGSQT